MNARGAFLLEALVATLVLALATLGFLGLTALATTNIAQSRWRSEAATLAAETVAQMSVSNPATLVAEYDSAQDGAGYRAFAASARHLPGVTASVNAPVIVVTPRSGSSAVTASVRLGWQEPGAAAPHRYAIDDVLVAW